jgi:hypothetical protein
MADNMGDVAARKAMEQIGKAYKYGTAGPNTFDCSGLIAYAQAGAGAPYNTHQTALQHRTLGTAVSLSNIRPGDVLCYDSSLSGLVQQHVTIFYDNNSMVDAMNPENGVRWSQVDNSWYKGNAPDGTPRFKTVRRPYAYSDTTASNSLVNALMRALATALREPKTASYKANVSLNMRTGAGTSFSVITTIPMNAKVYVIGNAVTADGYTWRKIEYPGYGQGWCVDNLTNI